MRDSAGKRSARPSAEISQRLTHVIGGFPGVSLPMLPLICVVFLKSSYVHMAISHPPLTCPHSHIWHHRECSAPLRAALGYSGDTAWMCALLSGSHFEKASSGE